MATGSRACLPGKTDPPGSTNRGPGVPTAVLLRGTATKLQIDDAAVRPIGHAAASFGLLGADVALD